MLFVWLPLVPYLFRPDPGTRQVLTGFNGWLHAHGRTLVVGGMLVAGLALTIDGILGVTGVI